MDGWESWTFKLDTHSGRVWVQSTEMSWQEAFISPTPTKYSGVAYRLVPARAPRMYLYLIDTGTGRTWLFEHRSTMKSFEMNFIAPAERPPIPRQP